MKKILIASAIALLLVLIITASVLKHLDSRTLYNESFVNGNSAGNLYNGGLFCESGAFAPSAQDDKAVRTMTLKDAMDHIHKQYNIGKSGSELLFLEEYYLNVLCL